jgi:hypothetical protein
LYGNVAGAKFNPMKFLLTLMIFALAFGGYSAASHAMGMEDCSSSARTQLEECQHADAASDQDHAQKHEKNGAAKCMDCTQCCASSAVILQTKTFSLGKITTVFAFESSQSQPQGRLFSLLRPPRTLA